MIVVSRINGERFGINAEHIERIEETPDTVLTLLDGKKYIVRESLSEVLDLVVQYRARILQISYSEMPPPPTDDIGLRLVKEPVDDTDAFDEAGTDAGADGRVASIDPSAETH